MKFKKLAQYWQEIDQTASRLEMTAILARLFKIATAGEIDKIVNLSLGRLRPKYEGVEFSLAEIMMVRVIGAAYNQPLAQVTRAFKQKGDLGELIPNRKSSSNLTVADVYQRLMAIAQDQGQGSQDRKVSQMAGLLKDMDSLSAKYLVRIPINNLRLGFSEMTVLDGLSWMSSGDKNLRPALEKAFNVCADIGRIAREYKRGGLKALAKIQVQVGVPLRPQKSERLPSAGKIVEKLKTFAVEGKWDGLRVQIHYDKHRSVGEPADLFGKKDGRFSRIFSRNLDNMTAMFPDVTAAVEKLKVDQVILDGEAVAFDKASGKLLPFQETVQRKRKHGVTDKAKELPLKVFVYDLLFLNGKSLIDQPFRLRRRQLEQILLEPIDTLELAEQAIVSDETRLRQLREKYLSLGLEGVMCKKLDTPYQAGARNFNWVKFKKVTQGELADTVDAVVMGYYAGRGKRTGLGLGAFLVGVPDAKSGQVGSIAKIGTGLSDEQWREMWQRAQKLKTKTKPIEYLVAKNLFPDVWVKPQMVVEIMADEITRSPIHAFSLALRFPRLVRWRDDKKVDEATGKTELEKLFKLQFR
ncbi:MAG: ATP-dependent DNA ligase [Patescibacteria group bacterium]|nr:ATP-dependent DNA ligase [Patescibacteria group bacterium]